MTFNINQPFVTQEQKYKYWEESKAEVKRLTKCSDDVIEYIANWVSVQRNDVPATGEEFANAIRSLKGTL